MKTKNKKTFLVIHGPNLNLLEKRDKKLYGKRSLDSINSSLLKIAKQRKVNLTIYQSNIEGLLVSKIQKAATHYDGILINPAAYTHTSIAIRDALMAVKKPIIEVHMTNIFKREPFRQQTLISDVVDGQVIGLGTKSYKLGLEALIEQVIQ
jgi:3-dehydroquinate dehydratase II